MSTADKLNYLIETKNQIKEAIEEKGVSIEDTDSFRSYADKIGKIQGGGSSEDTFWNLRTNGGTSGKGLFAYTTEEICNNANFVNLVENMDTSKIKDFSCMFYLSGFSELDFSKWDMSIANDITNMFYNSKLTKINFSNCNLNQIRSLSYTFHGSTELTEIDLSNCNTNNITNMMYTFYDCKKLIKILGILDMSKVTVLSSAFGYNANTSPTLLEEVKIKNLNRTGLDLSYCTSLSRDSLIYLINNLVETTTAKTLNLGATNLAKLTEEEIAVATEKGWTLA